MLNEEWTEKENAYCLIRLLEWRSKRDQGERREFIAELKQRGPFLDRTDDAISLHMDYYNEITNGKPTKIKADNYLVGICKAD